MKSITISIGQFTIKNSNRIDYCVATSANGMSTSRHVSKKEFEKIKSKLALVSPLQFNIYNYPSFTYTTWHVTKIWE